MTARHRAGTYAAQAGAMLLGAGIASVAFAASGQALDVKTHDPIEGVRLTLDCERDPWSQPEGHVHLRTVVRVTDAKGRYSFSLADQLGCSLYIISAEKDGYHWMGSNDFGDFPGRIIPTAEYFMREPEWVWAELERGVAIASGRQSTGIDNGQSPRATYDRWFSSFEAAIKIAKTAPEIAFVHENYCPVLPNLYAQLTARDKESMLKLRSQHREGGKWVDVKSTDFDLEYLPYCGARDP